MGFRTRHPLIAKKVGAQPPATLLEAMARRHPNVRIMWAEKERRWALVQVNCTPPLLITILKGHPTMANTVYALDRMSPWNFRNQWAVDNFLRDLDANRVVEEIDKRARDAQHEGHKELFKVMRGRIIVPRVMS